MIVIYDLQELSVTHEMAGSGRAMSGSDVAGCHLLPEAKKINYKSAGKLPPLEIPPDLTAPGSDERYVVPDISPTGSATFSAYSKDRNKQPGASGTSVLPTADEAGARMERSGTQRWLVVKGEPEDIWPIVKEFWHELGFHHQGRNARSWRDGNRLGGKPRQDSGGSDSQRAFQNSGYLVFDCRARQVSHPAGTGGGDTTEIYISHRGMDEVMEGNVRTVWQPRPPDPDLEAEMLARLMMRFGVEEERARTTVASAGKGQERARMTVKRAEYLP